MNDMFIGNSLIDKIYIGNSEISKIYKGSELIYDSDSTETTTNEETNLSNN